MRIMNDYTIHCTEAQTKRALELGAPIEYAKVVDTINGNSIRIPEETGEFCLIPTAEQMVCWMEDGLLEEVHIEQDIDGLWNYTIYKNGNDLFGISNLYPSRKEATLAAIDAALEYLENLKH